jgi:hypothetical protein
MFRACRFRLAAALLLLAALPGSPADPGVPLRPAPDASAAARLPDGATPEPARAAERYGSLPKGITFEEAAKGLDPVHALQYHAPSNSFFVNRSLLYRSPLPRAEMLEVVEAIALDDRLGLSLVLDEESNRIERTILYGGLEREHAITRPMTRADLFVCAVVFGWPDALRRTTLPGDYRPRQAVRRRIPAVCYGNYTAYVFGRERNVIRRRDLELRVMLVPMARERAPDGGYLPDYRKLAEGVLEPADRENLRHLLAYREDYLELPVLARAVRVGEAAAFVRHVRDSGIDLRALHRILRTSR